MGVPTSYEHVISHQDKPRPPTYETMAEDSLRLHRRPVLFTAFLRALVLLLQIRLRSLRRVANRNHPTGCSGSTVSGDPIESIDLDDPNCLSLAWIALCRKLRIFSETIEKKIQNELKEASQKDEDPPNEQGNQTVSNGTSQQAEASDPVPSGLSNAPSEQSQLKQSAPPQPAARRQDSSSQQLKRSPSGQARPKASISRQQSGVTSTSTRKAPEATRSTGTGPGTASNMNDSRAKDPSQWRIGTPRESSLRSSDVVEMAACAGRHAEAFRHAALAEKCCTLDEALHRALFSSSSQRVGSSKS
ncbi:uncharacterized protein EMH_0093620 [Eimeria mitis]|uniref:Uncharacterized protein n=1 Tax=Eimeria mitis TaxID=44415 RepID=U6KF70_9EIME|nr:uncharacterized protein EMH_0093620 [Eimeria mitis]CDJ36685.1 hypothetical protein EMH_0093620 [Eimeria mitis]